MLEAVLGMTPPYVRVEVARLLPQLGSAEQAPGERAEEWRQERLFTAIAELLEAAAARTGLCLVVEDIHWADTATLDFLTFLVRAGHGSAVTVVVTCRSDEAPLEPRVSDWLGYARANAAVEEIRMGPLSARETADQVAGLVGGPPPAQLASDVFARGEATRSLPSSWSRPRWPSTRRASRTGHAGCRPGWANCWRHGRRVAPRRRRPSWRRWRWRVVRSPKICWS